MGGMSFSAADEPNLAIIHDAAEERFLLDDLIPEALCAYPGYLLASATGSSSRANVIMTHANCLSSAWRKEIGAEGVWLGLSRSEDKALRWANGAELVAVQGTSDVLATSAAQMTGAIVTDRGE
jgi:hypothetical protein